MITNQRFTNRRVSKQFWRDFGRIVRTSRIYAKAGLEAQSVVTELDELVRFYDLENYVQCGIPDKDDAQVNLPFESQIRESAQ